MVPRPYQLDFLEEEDDGDKPCLRWIKELTPAKRHAIGVSMEQVLQGQGISVCEEKAWGKQLGGGVFEFRLMRKRPSETKQKDRPNPAPARLRQGRGSEGETPAARD